MESKQTIGGSNAFTRSRPAASCSTLAKPKSTVVKCETLSKTSMISTLEGMFNLRKVFRFLGCSIPQQHCNAYILYSIILNGFVCIGFPAGFVLSYWRMFYSGLDQLETGLLMTSIQALMGLSSCQFKFYMLILMRYKWRSTDKIIKLLDQRCQSSDEMDELRQCVRQCNRCVVYYIAAYWAYSTSTFLGGFVMNWPPFNIYIPFLDWRRSRLQFVITSLIEFMLANVGCVQQAFNDSFGVVYVCILRTHMKILLQRFAKLGNASMSLDENLDSLKQCIRDHKNYLKLYDIIAPIISITLFIQFTVTACILSTTLVNFMLIATDFYSRIGSFFYIIAIILEILPVCYYAQCLMDDSNRLAEVIFHSNWIDQDVRYRKMLVFLMQRTQCTKNLTAGKLFPINLSCCLSIVKFSFTLYTFIKTMGLKEKFGTQ